MNLPQDKTVLILGAGVNGCALARELLLNGISVCIVDASDIAWGATSRSSRLIHGGLRYLEYGDFHLVRESLQERLLLRKLAPENTVALPVLRQQLGFGFRKLLLQPGDSSGIDRHLLCPPAYPR